MNTDSEMLYGHQKFYSSECFLFLFQNIKKILFSTSALTTSATAYSFTIKT
ncbi:hypothetical protein ECDEC6A_5369 [Escherichia coli DEC6A]|nr:hypothetical protein ECDEC6A_5369 [Escherichia coli DEC6A]